jgi:hypothetical protein
MPWSNLSSSSSSSLGEDLLGGVEVNLIWRIQRILVRVPREVWASLLWNVGKSPTKSRMSRSKSPMKQSWRSPTQSPLADVSPNHSRGQSPKRSPLKSPLKSTVKKALSPDGTYSLKEAAGIQTKQPDKPKSNLTLPSLGKPVPTPDLRHPHQTVNDMTWNDFVPRCSLSRLHESTIGRDSMGKQMGQQEQRHCGSLALREVGRRRRRSRKTSVSAWCDL